MCLYVATEDSWGQLIKAGVVDFGVALLTAAIIGAIGFLLREKILGYAQKAKLLDSLGIVNLKKYSNFTRQEFRGLLKNAERIQVFYRTGIGFWRLTGGDKDTSILAEAISKNSDLKIQVLLADPNSEIINKVSEAERVVGVRGKNSKSKNSEQIKDEIPAVEEILKQYPGIEYKYDAEFYAYPYILITYRNKKNERRVRAYAGLNVQPLLTVNALQIVSDCRMEEDIRYELQDDEFNQTAKLAEQLELNFQTAWSFARKPGEE